jgi:plasmid stabilization system protein ParE
VRLRTTSIANTDIAEAALWLKQQRPGLADAFLNAVEGAFKQIVSAPLACSTFVSPSVRFRITERTKIVGRFAYRIIFSLQADEVIVVAVAHAHRDLDEIVRDRVAAEDRNESDPA